MYTEKRDAKTMASVWSGVVALAWSHTNPANTTSCMPPAHP